MISPQLFKTETSYLVYRSTTTSCIVGLQRAFSYLFFLLFVPFSFFPNVSSKISPQLLKIENSYLVYRSTVTSCFVGLQRAFSYLFFLLFVPFSFFPNFSSNISPQLLKKETSYLVYRFTMTSCIVELIMGLLLFVPPYICSFFFLSRLIAKVISTTV